MPRSLAISQWVTEDHPDKVCDQISDTILDAILEALAPAGLVSENTELLINPAGKFVSGDPRVDVGITGRKTAEARFTWEICDRVEELQKAVSSS